MNPHTSRSHPLLKILLVLALFALPSLAFGESSWMAMNETFAPKGISDEMAKFITPLRGIFIAIGVIFLMARASRIFTKEENMRLQFEGLAKVILGVAVIAALPIWQGDLVKVADAMAEGTGLDDVGDVGKELWKLFLDWQPVGSAASESIENMEVDPATAEKDPGWWSKAWGFIEDAGDMAKELITGIIAAISQGIQKAIIFILGMVACLCLIITTLLQLLAGVFQRFLLEIAFAMLPLFVSALFFEPMRTQGVQFILRTISLAMWPFAWAIGNVMVVWLVTTLADLMNELAAATLAGIGVSATGLPVIAGALPYMAHGAVFLLVVGVVIIVIASLVNLIMAPIMFGKMLTQGAHMMGSMVAATAAGSAIAAGTIASVGAGVVAAGGGAAAGMALNKGAAAMSAKGPLGKALGGGMKGLANLVQSPGFANASKMAGRAGNLMARSGHLFANSQRDDGGFSGRSIGEYVSGGQMNGMHGERKARSGISQAILNRIEDYATAPEKEKPKG